MPKNDREFTFKQKQENRTFQRDCSQEETKKTRIMLM